MSTLFLLTACRSTNVMVVEPQVEVPEVAGGTGEYGVRAQITPARSYRVARFPEERPPNMAIRTEETEQSVAILGAEAGLGTRVEVGAFAGPGITESGCAGVVGKAQLFGPSRASAKAGDLAIGIASHMAACASENDGTTAGYSGRDGYPWKVKSSSQTLDLGASVGYHVLDRLMIYGGLALGATRAEANVKQGQSNDGASAGGNYSAHANGEGQTLALGLNYGAARAWVNLKGTYAHNNSDPSNPDHASVAIGSGVQF